MAYENINVNTLSKTLDKIDNISSSDYENFVNKLSNSEWSGGIINRIKTATNKEISEIKEIQKKINKYKTACDYIEEYQDLDDDIKRYNNKLDSYEKDRDRYNDKLNSHKRTMRNYSSKEPEINKSYTQSKIDYYSWKLSNANSNISDMNSKLSSAKSKQSTLRTKIDNLIG